MALRPFEVRTIPLNPQIQSLYPQNCKFATPEALTTSLNTVTEVFETLPKPTASKPKDSYFKKENLSEILV